jgi:hypothetical protein
MGGPSAATGPRPSSRGDRGALVGMTGVMLVMTGLASALVEVPLIDDWTYAWSVEHFLRTGELRMLEWSAHYPLAPILWGALFSQLLGFSFAVLRLSTVVLAWAGLLAFYGTLRELGIRPLCAGLGTLLLLLAHLRPTKVTITVGMAGVLLWGTSAVTGTIDQFSYHRTVVEARDWLLRHGVAAVHIDAGYALTG